MQALPDEQERLSLHENPARSLDDRLHLTHSLPLYHCNLCRDTASHPVLPPCGHLHCWECLHPYDQCPVCEAPFNQDDLFSLYLDEANARQLHASLPPKPKPRYSKKIRNTGGLNAQEGVMMRVQDNLEVGAPLTGYGYFPPLALHTLDSLDQQEEPEDSLKGKMCYTETLLFVIILLMLLFS